MRFREIITEVSAEDLYPKSFAEFRARYQPHIGDHSLYVNFTDAVGNVLDKSFSPKPNHADPQGLYAYPLEYVLNHPADIAYGQQARYLRVIRDRSSNKLVLNNLSAEAASGLLQRMGVQDPQKKMAFVQRRYSYAGGNLIAKQFLGVLQTYLEVGQKATTTNQQQTALLRRAGLDAVEDKSRSESEAIIYRAEPEQIIFLARSAFEVVEVVELRQESAKRLGDSDPRERLRALPGMIAQAIGDRIVANNLTADRAANMTFYTAEKRKIVITMKLTGRFMKSHREHGTHSGDTIAVTLAGPGFKTIRKGFEADASFKDIAQAIASALSNHTPAEGKAYDRQSEIGPDIQKVVDLFAGLAAVLKLPFTPPADEATAYRVYTVATSVNPGFVMRIPKKEAIPSHIAAVVDRVFPGRKAAQAQQIADIYSALLKRRGVSPVDALDIEKAGRMLGIDAAPTTKAYEKKYGEMTVSRQGTTLMMEIAGAPQKIAEIDNQTLKDWQKPRSEMDYTLFRKYAADLCDYLSDQMFVVDGYDTFLSQFYNIAFKNDEWVVADEIKQRIAKIGDVEIYKMDYERYTLVQISRTGELDLSDIGPAFAGKKQKYHSQTELFTLVGNQIVHIGENAAKLISANAAEKKGGAYMPTFEDMYGGRRIGAATFEPLIDGGFDPIALAEKEGWVPSVKLKYQLSLFGMVGNSDNSKVGKRIIDTLNPIGTYAGIEVFTYVPFEQWVTPPRHFVVIDGEKPKSIMRTERDEHHGVDDIKIKGIADDLTDAERQALKMIIADRGLAVPTKFKPNLSVRGSKK